MKTDSDKFVFLSAEFYRPLPPVNTIPVRKLHETGVRCKTLPTTEFIKTWQRFKTFDCHASKYEHGMTPAILKYNQNF